MNFKRYQKITRAALLIRGQGSRHLQLPQIRAICGNTKSESPCAAKPCRSCRSPSTQQRVPRGVPRESSAIGAGSKGVWDPSPCPYHPKHLYKAPGSGALPHSVCQGTMKPPREAAFHSVLPVQGAANLTSWETSQGTQKICRSDVQPGVWPAESSIKVQKAGTVYFSQVYEHII